MTLVNKMLIYVYYIGINCIHNLINKKHNYNYNNKNNN